MQASSEASGRSTPATTASYTTGFARDMLRQIVGGNIAGALEGGEKVFYFTPGMRYLRAFEHVIFGETYLGYLSPSCCCRFWSWPCFGVFCRRAGRWHWR